MNESLRAELLSMRAEDIATRTRLAEAGELDEDAYHPVMKAVHERNNKRIQEIVEAYGWPPESEVGEDGSEAVWLVVQHAVLEPDFQARCVDLLKAAVASGEARGWFLAYLQDRVLIRRGERQIYGTQHEVRDGRVYPLPTESPDQVNARRAALNLWSQEEHTAHLQRDYDSIQANREKHRS